MNFNQMFGSLIFTMEFRCTSLNQTNKGVISPVYSSREKAVMRFGDMDIQQKVRWKVTLTETTKECVGAKGPHRRSGSTSESL